MLFFGTTFQLTAQVSPRADGPKSLSALEFTASISSRSANNDYAVLGRLTRERSLGFATHAFNRHLE
jgi:hypothetical protein